jgi:hypothetical protein
MEHKRICHFLFCKHFVIGYTFEKLTGTIHNKRAFMAIEDASMGECHPCNLVVFLPTHQCCKPATNYSCLREVPSKRATTVSQSIPTIQRSNCHPSIVVVVVQGWLYIRYLCFSCVFMTFLLNLEDAKCLPAVLEASET